MRYLIFLIAGAMMVGCASNKYDKRLNGTWHSNRDETVAAAFRRDSRWTNVPPAKLEQFKQLFGHLTVTYSGTRITVDNEGRKSHLTYHVIERGGDHVTIRTKGGGFSDEIPMRIQFVDNGEGYWNNGGRFLGEEEEKFDKVQKGSKAAKASMKPHDQAATHPAPAQGTGP
jgi:hypothetical protein